MTTTAVDYLREQAELERQARELMPYDPKSCTYESGELRQPVFACITCSSISGSLVGVCYSCLIQCHSTHVIEELFSKRNFVCDCGTSRTQGECHLRHLRDDIASSSNQYNQNYRGLFCSCSERYDPTEETRNMIQCYFGFNCGEDWFHEDCILGDVKDKVNRQMEKSSNENDTSKEFLESEGSSGLVNGDEKSRKEVIVDRAEKSDTADDGIENSKVDVVYSDQNTDENENEQNATKIKVKPNNDEIPPDKNEESSESIEQSTVKIEPNFHAPDQSVGSDQKFPSLDDFDVFICWKCVNTFPSAFSQLSKSDYAFTRLHESQKPAPQMISLPNKRHKSTTMYSIFLKEGFRDYLAEISHSTNPSPLKTLLQHHNYLFIDDPIYEPPEDDNLPSSSGSLLDLGTDALLNFPKDKAIQGIQALEQIKSKLKDFFKPYAEGGKVVTEEEVKTFFSKISDK